MSSLTHDDLCDGLTAEHATALLLLVGAPEPFATIVREVRRNHRLGALLIGAPAGQPELAEVHSVLGVQGAGIPFLQYLPDQLSQAGIRVIERLAEKLGEAPSFVALEGYDAAKVVGALCGLTQKDLAIADIWQGIDIEGARGRIRFPGQQTPACGNGVGRRSKWLIGILRIQAASASMSSTDCTVERIGRGNCAHRPQAIGTSVENRRSSRRCDALSLPEVHSRTYGRRPLSTRVTDLLELA